MRREVVVRLTGWLLAFLLSPGAVAGEAVASCAPAETCIARLVERCTQVARPGEDHEVQSLARTLVHLGDNSIPTLRTLLKDQRMGVRAGAAKALGLYGATARAAVPDLMEAIERGVTEAAWALGAIGDPGAVPAIKAVLLREGRSPEALALTRLGRAGFEALGSTFAAPELTERVASILLEAFREGGEGMEAALPGLRVALEDGSRPSFVRAYAAASLGELGPRGLEAAPILRDVMRDPSPLVQQSVLDALSQIGDRNAVPLLLERTRAPDWSTRLAAFIGLAHLGPLAKAAEMELIRDLSSADFEQRALAAEALGWLRQAQAVPALITVLQGNSWSAAEQAAYALGRIGSREGLTALREAGHHHWSKRVRQAAAAGIADIQRPTAHPSPAHDFREVDRARRVLAALSEVEGCPGTPEAGWRVVRGGALLQIRPEAGGEDVPTLLPAVLPPVKLGRDDGFHERMRGHSVADGWLVAKDAGEWGGALWFVGWDGRKVKLIDQPLEGFVETASGLFGIGPLPHRSRSAGALWKLFRADGGDWRADAVVELPGAPTAWQAVGGNALVVVTPSGAVELAADGRVRELMCVAGAQPD